MRARIAFRPLRLITDTGTFGLTPREADILFCLMADRFIPIAGLIDIFYGDREDGGPEWAANCIKVHTCRLRKKLVGSGWMVKRWGMRFYSLEEER